MLRSKRGTVGGLKKSSPGGSHRLGAPLHPLERGNHAGPHVRPFRETTMKASVCSLVAVASLLFASGCVDGALCEGESEDEVGEEVASAEHALTSGEEAPPAANPVNLIARCSALPGASKEEIIACMAAAAPSSVPGTLVNACKSLGLNMPDLQRCLAAGALSAKPDAVMKACKLAWPSSELRLSCFQQAARSTQPDLLVPACRAAFSGTLASPAVDLNVGPLWECLKGGALSPAPDVLVSLCATTSNRLACIQSAAPSPKPEVIINACKPLTNQRPTDFAFCLSSAARAAQPEVVVSSCSALPGLAKLEVVSCINYAARSPTPELVIEACTNAPVFGPEDRLACIAGAVGFDLVSSQSGAGFL